MTNTEKPKEQTEAGKAFAAWVEERRKLTEEEISDIESEIQDLKRGIAPLDLKPRTEYGVAFAQWAQDRPQLSEDEISEIEAQIEKLKPARPPAPIPAEEPLPPGRMIRFLKTNFFDPRPLEPGESTFDRWFSEKARLSQEEAKRFDAEITASEKRLAEMGWWDPEAIPKLRKELERKKPPPAPVPKQPTVKPKLLIERTPYPKWWKDSLNAKIDLTAPGSATLATVSGNLRLFVATIVITVTGETQITIRFGNAGSSGPIYLGGADQPMGIVIATGNSPAPCGDGNLTITATDPGGTKPSIGGFATCFVEKV